MASVAPNPYWDPHQYGQYYQPYPPPFIPGRPRPPVNNAPSGPYPRPGTAEFDQAAFGTDPEPAPQRNEPRPDWPDSDAARPPQHRNRSVRISTPSGGHYTTSGSPVIPAAPPQWTRQDAAGPRPSRTVWSRFLRKFTQPGAEAFEPVVPTVPPTLEQRQQLLSLLLQRVPTAESIFRPLVNLIDDSQMIKQLIYKLNHPITQDHFLDIEGTFTMTQDEQEDMIRALNDPNEAASLLTQFIELILDRALPTVDEVPAPRNRASCCLGRLIHFVLRNGFRSLKRKRRQSTAAHTTPSAAAAEATQLPTVQQDGTETFPIHRIRESSFRNVIVEPFTCTVCATNIPANRTRGTDPQLGINLHLRCPNQSCATVFCRGCHRIVTGCQPNCTARHSCALKRCCSNVRAIAIFEYLSVFDEDYLTRIRNFHHGAVDAHTSANRLAFLQYAFDPANRRDPRCRGFISVLKRTLKYVNFWLAPGVPENVVCTVVPYMVDASFLMEAIDAFLTRGIENLAHFRARGYLIHRIVDLVFSWVERGDSFYDLIRGTQLIIDRSPGTRCLIWDPDSVWESHYSPARTRTILDNMRNLWTNIETAVGAETLRNAANEFDTRLYEHGHDLSLLQRREL